MEELLHECLHPVMLGANALCHACVREMEKQYGVGSTVLTGKRALTLRFLPTVTLVSAPPTLSDELLFTVLQDVAHAGNGRIPLLVLCDQRYEGFVARNESRLEERFILRTAEDILGEYSREF